VGLEGGGYNPNAHGAGSLSVMATDIAGRELQPGNSEVNAFVTTTRGPLSGMARMQGSDANARGDHHRAPLPAAGVASGVASGLGVALGVGAAFRGHCAGQGASWRKEEEAQPDGNAQRHYGLHVGVCRGGLQWSLDARGGIGTHQAPLSCRRVHLRPTPHMQHARTLSQRNTPTSRFVSPHTNLRTPFIYINSSSHLYTRPLTISSNPPQPTSTHLNPRTPTSPQLEAGEIDYLRQRSFHSCLRNEVLDRRRAQAAAKQDR
jgi:hypothetical protein